MHALANEGSKWFVSKVVSPTISQGVIHRSILRPCWGLMMPWLTAAFCRRICPSWPTWRAVPWCRWCCCVQPGWMWPITAGWAWGVIGGGRCGLITCCCIEWECDMTSDGRCLWQSFFFWLPLHDASIWVNYNDLTATSLESWLIRGIIPQDSIISG